MNFEDYLWYHKLTNKEASIALGLDYASVANLKKRNRVPRLDTAMLVHEYTNGEVSLDEMMPEGHMKAFKEKRSRVQKKILGYSKIGKQILETKAPKENILNEDSDNKDLEVKDHTEEDSSP
jgi:hypothetical protein